MSISPPNITVTILPEAVNKVIETQKILFVGQQTSSGTATGGTLVQNIGNENQEDTLFGSDSMLAGMIRQSKRYNKNTRTDAIVLDDEGGSVAATGTFAITGPATEDGTISFAIGSRSQFKFDIAVTSGDSATIIGDALDAAIVTNLDTPFTSANVTGTVTITAANAGLVGNDIGLEVTGSVAGVGVVITAMASGATDPVLTSVFDLVQNIRYQTVVFADSYLLQQVAVDFLNDRFNTGSDKLLDGVGIATITNTFSNLIISTVALNSQNYVLLANRTVDIGTSRGSALFELNYEISAQFGGIRALRLTEDTNISEFVVSQHVNNDSRGGFHISTLPYHATPYDNLSVIDIDQMWSDTERDFLKDSGFGILGNNVNNSEIIADDIVTRYKTNAAGDLDLSFKFLNYVDQAVTVRDVFHTTLKTVYAQTRLTDGSLVPNFNITNGPDIKAELISIYEFLAANAVVPDGDAAFRAFRSSLVVTVFPIEGRVEISMLDPVVTQLRDVDVIMQLTFSVNS